MHKNQPVALPEPLTEDKQTFLRYLHVSSGGNKTAEKRSCLFKIKTSSHDHLCIFFPGEFMMQEFVPTCMGLVDLPHPRILSGYSFKLSVAVVMVVITHICFGLLKLLPEICNKHIAVTTMVFHDIA